MEITLSKGIFKKSLSVLMAFLIAMSTMWMGLSVVEFDVGAVGRITDGNVTDGNIIEASKCGDNAYYKIYGNGVAVISGSGKTYGYYYDSPFYYNRNIIKHVIIEDEITTIGDGLFCHCSKIESITIGENVIEFDREAFLGCSIERVYAYDISSWLKIKYNGIDSVPTRYGATLHFGGVSAEEIVIPDGVNTIKAGAFYNCDNVKKVTIPDSVTKIDKYAFYSCNKLCNLELPKNLTAIGEYAFYNCDSITDVKIPDNVTTVGKRAFAGCNDLVNIEFGKGLTTISEWMFGQCDSLESVTVPNHIASIDSSAFYDCDSLKSVVISDSVTSLGAEVFRGCNNLEDIKLSYNIKAINDYAFYNCDSITNIEIPHSVTAIGNCAFRSCNNLKNVTIPDSVSIIGFSAFYGCNNLEDVIMENGVATIDSYAFYSCNNLGSVTIPDSIIKISDYAFPRLIIYCYKNSTAETYAKSKNYPYVLLDGGDEVNIIGGNIGKNFTWSLDKRTGLLEINGSGKLPYFTDESPAPWEAYGDYITDIKFPEGLLVVSNKAFENLKRIKTVTIPDSVTIIDSNAFYNCVSLESVTIGESVTSIGYGAFGKCNSLISVYAPDAESWFNIDFVAEGNYSSGVLLGVDYNNPLSSGVNLYFDGELVTDLVVPEGITEIKATAFYNYDNLKSVTISSSVTIIGLYAFYSCGGLESVVVPEGVNEIGQYAFAACTNLKSIELPSTVDFDSWYRYCIFENCKSLETVKFNVDENYQSKVEKIQSYMFNDCSSLKEIVLPASVKSIESNSFPATLEKITILNPNCIIKSDCGITYNSEIVGFKGSTAETFADEKAAYFTDIETIHSHSYKVISDTKATCTEDGLYLERCSCGKENKEVRAKTGHKFKDYEVTLQPTCTSYGEQKAFCENCDYYEMQHISPTYHKNRESRPQQNPTCTSYGYTSGVYCPDCKTWISGHVLINMTAHSYTEKIIDEAHLVSEATITSPAVYRYDCANCAAIGSETFTYGEAIGLGRPATLTATQTTNSITLTWSAVKEASGYLVFRWLGSSWQACALADGTSCTLTGLAAGTKYKYAVIAYGSGNGNVVIANAYTTVETVTKADAPSKVSATQSTSAIKLSWTACSGATGYRIYYKSGNTWKVSVSSTTATSHTYTGLKAGAKYTFAVRPYIKNGSEIIWSDYVEYSAATTPATVTAKATSSATGKIALSWNQVNGADGYQVYYKTGNGSYKLYKTVSASTNSLNFSNLKSGTKYSFAVRAGIKTSGGNIFGAYKGAAVTVR